MKLLITTILFLSITFNSCKNKVTKEDPRPDWTTEESIKMQSTFTEEEEDEINLFLKRHNDWKMTKTGTGLRYFIHTKSDAIDSAKVLDLVTVDYSIQLLDGTICYTSEDKGPQSFIVEKSDLESGLHEAIKLMCTGDKALFILPSHLAHGLIGDTDKIPPLMPIIYEIELLKIKHNNDQ